MTGHTSFGYTALNHDRWVLLYWECCLLYTICVTGHCSFHWLGPTMSVISLFVVLLVSSQSVRLVIVVAAKLDMKLLKWTVITLFTVLLVLDVCLCCDWVYWSYFLAWCSFVVVTTNLAGFLLVFCLKYSILLLIMVELLVMKLFELKIAKTWSGWMARESPESGFIDEVCGLPLGMALPRLLARIWVPETCPMAHF